MRWWHFFTVDDANTVCWWLTKCWALWRELCVRDLARTPWQICETDSSIIPILQRRKASQRWHNVPLSTWLVSGRTGVWIQVRWALELAFLTTVPLWQRWLAAPANLYSTFPNLLVRGREPCDSFLPVEYELWFWVSPVGRESLLHTLLFCQLNADDRRGSREQQSHGVEEPRSLSHNMEENCWTETLVLYYCISRK